MTGGLKMFRGKSSDYGILVGRLLLSVIFVSRGLQLKTVINDFELCLGLLLLFGFQAKLSAALLVFTLFPSLLTFVLLAEPAAFLKDLAIVGALFNIVSHGPGELSADQIIERSRNVA